MSDWTSPAQRYYAANISPVFPATATPTPELELRWQPVVSNRFMNNHRMAKRAAIILENESFLLKAFQDKGLWIKFFEWCSEHERPWFVAAGGPDTYPVISPKYYYPSVLMHLMNEKR